MADISLLKNMYPYECYNAKQKIDSQRKLVKNFSPGMEGFEKEFKKFIELVITVQGHSLCMDVASERKRMSRLITSAVCDSLK
jgi:hypothetical protein